MPPGNGTSLASYTRRRDCIGRFRHVVAADRMDEAIAFDSMILAPRLRWAMPAGLSTILSIRVLDPRHPLSVGANIGFHDADCAKAFGGCIDSVNVGHKHVHLRQVLRGSLESAR